MKFHTALRPWIMRRLEKIDRADLVIGIPCFNNDSTIEHVVDSLSEGIARYYREKRSVIIISDGGSTDDTREVSKEKSVYPFIEKIVSIYRGLPGKGSSLRMIFEAATMLDAQACLLFDSDLRSVTPEWVKTLADPVFTHGHDFVAPVYSRYKYDATITNNIAYNLTRALYGQKIRQPIGGDFGLSRDMVGFYTRCGRDIWTTDIARFGIDIWMTTTAIVNERSVCQAYLGAKIHDVKDPLENLGPMFRQVVFSLFQLMEENESKWKSVLVGRPVPTYGSAEPAEPPAFDVNLTGMVANFRADFRNYSVLWEKIVNPQSFAMIKELTKKPEADFLMPTEAWAKIVYDFAAAFHHWTSDRKHLIDTMRPLYHARVASFVNRTRDMPTPDAEKIIEQQAQVFEDLKPYLFEIWEKKNENGDPL